MTAIRVRGWLTDGTITVPADVQGAIADMAADVRDLKAENERLVKHSGDGQRRVSGCVPGGSFGGADVTDGDLHALFCEWAVWCRTKRLYAPSPNPQSIIGTLVRLPSGRTGDARLDPLLASLHMAIVGAEGRDGHIISVEYLWRPYSKPKVPVKRIAGALGFSRQRWYQLVKDARRRVYGALPSNLSVCE